ncbi:MAG: hypothetical protein ACRDAU_17480 [Clostridium sp.]
MRYISGKIGGKESLEYAKNIINKIDEISSFEAFNDEKTPYYEDFGIGKYYYNFVVRDILGNEVWFDTNCGYRGSKPSVTEQILQLFGVRDDYDLYNKKILKVDNLSLVHNINLVVVINNKLTKKSKKLMFIKVKPNSAKDRYNLLKSLKSIGSFKVYSNKMIEYEKEFKEVYEDKSFGMNNMNLIYLLDNRLSNLKKEYLKEIIEVMISRKIGQATEFEMKIL